MGTEVSMPDLLEKIDALISDSSETESILELASKLAIYAAENARKRQRQCKDEMETLKMELESERKRRKVAEQKVEQKTKAQKQLGRLLKQARRRNFRLYNSDMTPMSSPEPSE